MNHDQDTTLAELATLVAQLGSLVLDRHGPGRAPQRPVGTLNMIRHQINQTIEIATCEPETTDPRDIPLDDAIARCESLLETLKT